MPQINTLQKLTLAPKQAYSLFEKASSLADALEDIMEIQGNYSPEFVKGLRLAVKQAQTGKVKKFKSLKELS